VAIRRLGRATSVCPSKNVALRHPDERSHFFLSLIWINFAENLVNGERSGDRSLIVVYDQQ
jgi:hypothetical protein